MKTLQARQKRSTNVAVIQREALRTVVHRRFALIALPNCDTTGVSAGDILRFNAATMALADALFDEAKALSKKYERLNMKAQRARS